VSKKRQLRSLALASAPVILYLILISSVASASITKTRITNDGYAANPAIYDNKIVWIDFFQFELEYLHVRSFH